MENKYIVFEGNLDDSSALLLSKWLGVYGFSYNFSYEYTIGKYALAAHRSSLPDPDDSQLTVCNVYIIIIYPAKAKVGCSAFFYNGHQYSFCNVCPEKLDCLANKRQLRFLLNKEIIEGFKCECC